MSRSREVLRERHRHGLGERAGAFLLGIPSLWSTVAFGAITSIATIGLYTSYVIPILLRRTYPRNFERAVGAVLLLSGTWWLVSARRWFRGPHRQGDEAQLSELEAAR